MRPHKDMVTLRSSKSDPESYTASRTHDYKIGMTNRTLKIRYYTGYVFPFVTLVHFYPTELPQTVEWLTFQNLSKYNVKSGKGQSREVYRAALPELRAQFVPAQRDTPPCFAPCRSSHYS